MLCKSKRNPHKIYPLMLIVRARDRMDIGLQGISFDAFADDDSACLSTHDA
jgi:hypothetical protein